MTFEMVISGMTMGAPTGVWDSHNILDYQTHLKNKIQQVSDKYTNQSLSILFNSFTEKKHGEVVSSYDLGFTHRYADSGGIQMITTKNGITEELKDKVYRHQGTYADYAFIFDDIPIHIDKSVNKGMNVLNNLNGKYYVTDLIKPKALSTAKNIKRQIEIFDEIDSNTKIYIITQGDTIDNINCYVETIMNELSDYEISRIHGVALSTACVGTDFVSRYDVMYSHPHINLPEDIKANVHLLGVGNVSSLFPMTHNSQYFDSIKTLSYDSTRQTNSYLFKKYTDINHRTFKLNDSMSNVHRCISEIYDRNKIIFNEFNINDHIELIENATKYSSLNTEKACKFYNEDFDKSDIIYRYVHFYWTMEVISNFMVQIDNVQRGIYSESLKKNTPIFLMNKIRDYADYNEWKRQITYNKKQVKKINKISDIISTNKLEEWL